MMEIIQYQPQDYKKVIFEIFHLQFYLWIALKVP